jgi:precorrin-6B C5,15-methyltransferase / cobalt-precorrin-6B C5,C15-methyltransferase
LRIRHLTRRRVFRFSPGPSRGYNQRTLPSQLLPFKAHRLKPAEKIHIIGIGDDGLDGVTAHARVLIERADLLLGAESTLALVPGQGKSRLAVGTDLGQAIDRIQAAQNQSIVILASGDPLFYGVARYLCDKLGKDRFVVIPHVSSMQMAFARVKESWEDAFLTNLANHGIESVLEKIRVADKVGLFTSEAYPPAAVARALLDSRLDYFQAYVCENLGSPDERVTHGELKDIAAEQFSPLNVMILVRTPDTPDRPAALEGRRMFGNRDELFLQTRPKHGLLTPAEVRAIAISQLALRPNSIVWDIGAGSGSVSIECAQLAPQGKTYAIEMDAEDHQLIVTNAERFALENIVAVLGRAPDAWADLPDPDAIFVGGSGREIGRLVELAYRRLKPNGRLVANVGSIENLSGVHEIMHRQAPDVSIWMVNVARGTYQLERVRFEALNPTFLLAASKPR